LRQAICARLRASSAKPSFLKGPIEMSPGNEKGPSAVSAARDPDVQLGGRLDLRNIAALASRQGCPSALKIAEYFCGGGMVRLGLGDDWRVSFANDICPKKAAAYRANFGTGELVVADVAELKPADIPPVYLVWASPPCQDISLAGKQAGLAGARSRAFWPWWWLVESLAAEGRAPNIVAIENVTGLLTSRHGADIRAIFGAMSATGYCLGALVIDAALFVPQSRERVFIVAVRNDLPIPAELLRADPDPQWSPSALRKAVAGIPHVWWRLPMPPPREIMLSDLLERDARADPADLARLLELMAPRHRAKVDAAARSRGPGEVVVGAVTRHTRDQQRAEVRFGGNAKALRTAGGGSSIQTLLIIDDDGLRARKITPREAARLMGVADSYALPVNVGEAHTRIGDGVCVPVVRHLSEHLLTPLAKSFALRKAA
jgi:DNA (cytosine-5)-methyltransferase 1